MRLNTAGRNIKSTRFKSGYDNYSSNRDKNLSRITDHVRLIFCISRQEPCFDKCLMMDWNFRFILVD